MLRIALCDDERKILEDVSTCVKIYATYARRDIDIFCFDSALALLSAIEDGNSFDIFILDVYIGTELGTALAKSLRRMGLENPIIFLTTSIEHAPESFEMGTLRYLIKPIRIEKLYEALDAAIVQFEKQQEHLIKLKTENGMEGINASHILYSEAHDHYQYVRLSDNRTLKVRMTVAELYNVLMKRDGFIRVGSAYIINLRNIKNVTTTEVHLYNDFSIPIPRGKNAEIKRAFWNFQSEE